ncbi:MAG: M48 family metallopeptidase [Armatimonadota bacterium]|nr:M48 family metallopeptidase [Armatimonadota bacterium]
MRYVYMFIAFVLIVVFYITLIGILIGLAYVAFIALREGSVRLAFAAGFVDFVLIAGLFAREPPPLGIEKRREEAPQLFALVDEVAQRTDTAPPDEVYVSPDANLSVRQTAGILGLPIGARRQLQVGVAALQALTVDELRAVLAHEMGHFRKGDTAVGRFIARVPISVQAMLDGMRRGSTWWFVNPVYWYLFIFVHIYGAVISAMSRRQEFVADRVAAEAYGADVFSDGLTKLVVDGTVFDGGVLQAAHELMAEQKALVNAYETHREFSVQLDDGEREEILASVMEEGRGILSSHPTLAERLRALEDLPAAPERQRDERPAREVFEDPDAIEQEQTEFLSAVLYYATHGEPPEAEE